ncbi:MAG: hypothetical protein AAF654_12100 [Myxococcota bacterium]
MAGNDVFHHVLARGPGMAAAAWFANGGIRTLHRFMLLLSRDNQLVRMAARVSLALTSASDFVDSEFVHTDEGRYLAVCSDTLEHLRAKEAVASSR